jgi:hypothetical protein
MYFFKKINTCKLFDRVSFVKKSSPCHIRIESAATIPQRNLRVYILVCEPIDSAYAAAQGVVPHCAVGPTQSMNA